MPPRRRTATSNFGVGRRESHVADAFYARFEAPELSADEHVTPHAAGVSCLCGDARRMDAVADDSVALVVTSPPYFAGKQYEEELDREGVPGSYIEYLALLRDVFAECKRVLEPGGRIAVNVANLGRKPYRSLAADVMTILQDDLHLLPRGEIVWQKGEGASGSCAWGSFRSAANPVLRDVTERVVVASKGRFGRARSPKERRRDGLPHESSIGADDFMALTLDVWDIPPESAVRVRHPAPFPVELPQRLMELYTYRGDLVRRPVRRVRLHAGGGACAAGATPSGYDLDPAYVELARGRVGSRRARRRRRTGARCRATASCRRRYVGAQRWPAARSRRRASPTCDRTAACADSAWPSTSPATGRRRADVVLRRGGAELGLPRRHGPLRDGVAGPRPGPRAWRPAGSPPSSCSRRSCRGPAPRPTGRCGRPGRAGSSTRSTFSPPTPWRGSPPTAPAAAAAPRAGFLVRVRRGARAASEPSGHRRRLRGRARRSPARLRGPGPRHVELGAGLPAGGQDARERPAARRARRAAPGAARGALG